MKITIGNKEITILNPEGNFRLKDRLCLCGIDSDVLDTLVEDAIRDSVIEYTPDSWKHAISSMYFSIAFNNEMDNFYESIDISWNQKFEVSFSGYNVSRIDMCAGCIEHAYAAMCYIIQQVNLYRAQATANG